MATPAPKLEYGALALVRSVASKVVLELSGPRLMTLPIRRHEETYLGVLSLISVPCRYCDVNSCANCQGVDQHNASRTHSRWDIRQ